VSDTFAALIGGLHQVLTWPTPLYLVTGVFIGYGVGLLPGLGAPAALSFMLPVIIPLPPIEGLVLLTATAAVATGAGDLTSILLGVPGEATAAAIVPDGHALARRGEGGRAAGAAIASALMGSLIGVVVLVAFVPFAGPLLSLVQSPELAALAVIGICLIVPLSQADPVKGLMCGALGLALATVGLDPSAAEPRFTFGQLTLWDGLGLLPFALGVYAVPEALNMIRSRAVAGDGGRGAARGVLQGAGEAVRHAGLVGRCSAIGAAIGILPGIGASVSQWVAYAHAGKSARGSRPIGTGAIEGVIGPASATTATLGGAMVPTLALGIPGSLTTTLLLSALILKGISPGPSMLAPSGAAGHLTLVFAIIWCIVIASAMGAVIGATSLAWVARLANVRPSRLVTVVLTLILVGTIAERHATADFGILLLLGLLGYVLSVLAWPRAPLMLGFVLGPLVERRVLLSNSVYGWTWVLRPSVLVLAAGAVLFLLKGMPLGQGPARRIRPAQRGASPGDMRMSAGLVVLSALGLLMGLSLTGAPAFFPRVAFGAMLCLALPYTVASWRTRGVREAFASRPGTAEDAVRLGWFLGFVAAAWALGLVAGICLSALIYLRWDARESWRTTLTLTGALGLVAWALAVHVIGM
jgi:putative tricarboxylic transport membrane protein